MNEAAPMNVAIIVAATPAIVFSDPKRAEELFAHIDREIADRKPDLSMAKGRDEIKSFAFKITRTKTAIDDAGAELIAEANKTVNAVNAERRAFKTRLDELRDKARKPLTDWEEAESLRKQAMDATLNRIGLATIILAADSSEAIAARLSAVEAEELTAEVFQDKLEEAEGHKAGAIRSLATSLERAKQAEIDRAELRRLREEQADRDVKEKELAAEQLAEEHRAAEVRAEREWQARAHEEEQAKLAKAGSDARLKAERDADLARQKAEREHAEALAKVEREKHAIIDEQARKDREREAEAKRAAEIEAARAADREHRAEVMGEAATAIMGVTHASKANADKIILAILAGQVPHVTLRF